MFLSCCFAAAGGRMPDRLVETSSGPLRFHDVVAGPGHRLSGVVTNATARNWTSVEFQIEWLAADGNVTGRTPLVIHHLKHGESRSLSLELKDSVPADISNYRVAYRTGELEATYFLTMLQPERKRVLEYEDADTSFSFAISPVCFDVKFKNKTNRVLTVDWAGARFVDIFERQHVMAEGQAEVAPFAIVKELLEPAGEVTAGRVLPQSEDAGELAGKTVSLSIPVVLDGVRKEYRFVFQVAEVLY
jgi:hypothetical protein